MSIATGKVMFINDPFENKFGGTSMSIKVIFDEDVPGGKQTEYGWEKLFYATVGTDKAKKYESYTKGQEIQVVFDGKKSTIITEPEGSPTPTAPTKQAQAPVQKKKRRVVLFKDLVREEKLKFVQAIEVMREDDALKDLPEEELYTTIRGIMSGLNRTLSSVDVVYDEGDLPPVDEREAKLEVLLSSDYVNGDYEIVEKMMDTFENNLDAAIEFVSEVEGGKNKAEAMNKVAKKHGIDLLPF